MKNYLRIAGLPRQIRRPFRRALQLAGVESQTQWLYMQIRRTIREQQEIHGQDLFQAITIEESEVIRVVRSGAAELPHIIDESMIPPRRVEQILADLVDRGIIEERRRGGKSEAARGATVTMYFVKD